MNITPSLVRTLSILGQRGAFGAALTELAAQNEKIVALSADLCNTAGLDRFQKAYPSRLFNVGIAEGNMIGVAAGIADSGYIPFAATFTNFAALRACEQIRHFLGYMQSNVKVVGFGGGFAMEFFGNTHYGIEDIAAIRAIDNLIILSPSDGLSVVKCVEAAADKKAPIYIRLTGVMNMPIVYRSDFDFEIGKAIELKTGSDVVIFASGSVVANAIKAAEILEEESINAALFDLHTIKPLDAKTVIEVSVGKGLIVSVEEHSVCGGIGSAIAETLVSRSDMSPLLRLGANGYRKAGDYSYMIGQSGLEGKQIAEAIKQKLKETR
ncbi:MAG: transketolase [Helicobacteraceae bacterium]|jgi:transketolase|nr:transketolase [Helicobacteraceae bacterium]